MNASLDACVYIARLRVMPAAIPPAVSCFSCRFTVSFPGAVPFVRALKSVITPVLWNSYGASTMVCPEPTSTEDKLTTYRYQVIPYGLVLKPQRDIPYEVVAFWKEDQVSPLSDWNKTRGCQEVSC